MYKVLVADDEEVICTGIKARIERMENPLIGEVLLAFGGQQAERMAEEAQPHILITDIRMPDMDGLELIRRLMTRQPDLKCIILSGYDEFRYARDALKLGVVDYLLKPASMKELKEVLGNVAEQLHRQKLRRSEQEQMTYRNRDIAFENAVRRLITSEKLTEGIIRESSAELEPYFPHHFYCVSMVRLEVVLDSAAWDRLRKLADSLIKGEGQQDLCAFPVFDHKQNLILIVNGVSPASFENMHGRLAELSRTLRADWGLECAVSVSEVWRELENVVYLYRQAEKALEYDLLLGQGQLLDYALHKSRSSALPAVEKHLDVLVENIKLHRVDRTSSDIDAMFNRGLLQPYSIDVIKSLYARVFHVILHAAGLEEPEGGLPVMKDFSCFHSLEDVRIYLKKTVLEAAKSKEERLSSRSLEGQVRELILANLGRSVDMAYAANAMSMSYSYFSRLFKKETGMNFSEYLQKVRLEESLKLLEDPGVKIFELAEKVGFENAKHFTKTFSKYYGISPMEYKKSRMAKNR